MRNNFSDKLLNITKKQSMKTGISEDLIDRIYTSRLLGQNPNLVLHGGGNTSVKSKKRDLDGIFHNVIFVKGSGSDLSTIQEKDFPAVKLDPLYKIIKRKSLSDEQMVNYLRKNLIDVTSPNPSVETLVHASIDKKFVDHTHSNAILEITNRKNGLSLCKKIFGDEISVVPYVMPGFILAKKVDEIYKQNSNVKGLILYRHGIFTFGDTAKESYSRMISLVTKAEKFLKSEKQKNLKKLRPIKKPFKPHLLSPIVRGLVSTETSYIVKFRSNKKILDVINSKNAESFLSRGVVTPDHVLRVKPKFLVINIDDCKDLLLIKERISKKVTEFKNDYKKYFKKYNNPRLKNQMLDPVPQIIVIQNIGIFSIGKSSKSAFINGDVAEMAIKTIGNLEKKTSFESISHKDIFDVEYWSLEQAKLNKTSLPLSGKVSLITGGTGTLGLAIAEKFRSMGSEVILLDVNKKQLEDQNLKKKFSLYFCDVTRRESFKKVLAHICLDYGGLDFVISNAGSAHQSEIAKLNDSDLKKSFELNFFAHQIVASESVELMKTQNIGGCLLFNISKQAINPGKDFGAYGTSKAALLALCKQYALEYGGVNIRSNGVNADRIESGLLTKTMINKRSKSRRITSDEYLQSNLLKKKVLAEDVAEAFYNLSISKKTTAAILTVDGGNIEASLR
ncbi:MAG: bifunctional aldolase/short-chain dehydrogenase [Candidatus Pelagibacterales bacterium]